MELRTPSLLIQRWLVWVIQAFGAYEQTGDLSLDLERSTGGRPMLTPVLTVFRMWTVKTKQSCWSQNWCAIMPTALVFHSRCASTSMLPITQPAKKSGKLTRERRAKWTLRTICFSNHSQRRWKNESNGRQLIHNARP